MPWIFGKKLSLLEFVISGMILTIGILGMVPLLGVETFGTDLPCELKDANEIAQIEIDNLMQSSGWGELPYVSGPDSIDDVYIVFRSINDIRSDKTIPAGYARLNVRITWSDQDNITHINDYAVLKPYLGFFGQDKGSQTGNKTDGNKFDKS